jgi:hypothetical protein
LAVVILEYMRSDKNWSGPAGLAVTNLTLMEGNELRKKNSKPISDRVRRLTLTYDVPTIIPSTVTHLVLPGMGCSYAFTFRDEIYTKLPSSITHLTSRGQYLLPQQLSDRLVHLDIKRMNPPESFLDNHVYDDPNIALLFRALSSSTTLRTLCLPTWLYREPTAAAPLPHGLVKLKTYAPLAFYPPVLVKLSARTSDHLFLGDLSKLTDLKLYNRSGSAPVYPSGLKHLTIRQKSDWGLGSLPPGLATLKILSNGFDQPLNTLPAGLKTLEVGSVEFTRSLNDLPEGLSRLELRTDKHLQNLTKLPPRLFSVKILTYSLYEGYPFPDMQGARTALAHVPLVEINGGPLPSLDSV